MEKEEGEGREEEGKTLGIRALVPVFRLMPHRRSLQRGRGREKKEKGRKRGGGGGEINTTTEEYSNLSRKPQQFCRSIGVKVKKGRGGKEGGGAIREIRCTPSNSGTLRSPDVF